MLAWGAVGIVVALDAVSLDRGETGWTVDDRIMVVSARARRIEIR